jgi:hypothetical protein
MNEDWKKDYREHRLVGDEEKNILFYLGSTKISLDSIIDELIVNFAAKIESEADSHQKYN